MREPAIILRFRPESKRHSSLLHGNHPVPADTISSLKWTAGGSLGQGLHLINDANPSDSPVSDLEVRIRLIAIHTSGKGRVFSIARSANNPPVWAVEADPTPMEGIQNPLHNGTFVIDSKKGAMLDADREQLLAFLQNPPAIGSHSIFVVAGSKGARSFFSMNGERIGRAEWGNKVGVILTVQIVEQGGECNESWTIIIPTMVMFPPQGPIL